MCLHSIYLPDWDLREWDLCMRALLARDGMHGRWIERTADVLLECDHAGWEWDRRVGGWAGESGDAEIAPRSFL